MSCNHKFNYHLYITEPADFEFTVDVPKMYDDDGGIRIRISKVGGGTVGMRYAGNWYYSVVVQGKGQVAHGDDLSTGTPSTHRQAARTLAGFIVGGTICPELSDQSDRLALFAG